jgi:hypothetical protein
VIVEFEFMVEMNLVQIGTNEFFPNSFVSLRTKCACSPARTATRNWGSKCSVGTLPALHAAILSHRYS